VSDFARLWPVRPPWRPPRCRIYRGPGNVSVTVSFATGAVRSAILATAGLLVNFDIIAIWLPPAWDNNRRSCLRMNISWTYTAAGQFQRFHSVVVTCLTCATDCVSAADDPMQQIPVNIRGNSSRGYDVEYVTRSPGKQPSLCSRHK